MKKALVAFALAGFIFVANVFAIARIIAQGDEMGYFLLVGFVVGIACAIFVALAIIWLTNAEEQYTLPDADEQYRPQVDCPRELFGDHGGGD